MCEWRKFEPAKLKMNKNMFAPKTVMISALEPKKYRKREIVMLCTTIERMEKINISTGCVLYTVNGVSTSAVW